MAAPAPPRRPQRFWSSAGRLLGLLAPQRRALVLVLLAGTVSVALNGADINSLGCSGFSALRPSH